MPTDRLFDEDPEPDGPPPQDAAAEPRVLSVWELTAQMKDLLGTSFSSLWVAGEISNFARPRRATAI